MRPIHYVIYRNPSHNQVYFSASQTLCLEELTLAKLPVKNIDNTTISNIPVVTFESEPPLDPDHLLKIARLSFLYALFEREGDLLRPIPLPNPYVLDESLCSILKYKGKTNDVFTKMLINLALFTANIPPEKARLFDPVAGRGTTLFSGLTLGMSVYGTEIYDKNVHESVVYLKKFLEKGKIKHKNNTIRLSGENRSFTAKKHTIDLENTQFQLIEGDTRHCDKFFSKGFFDVLVGDLPYGVQHGSRSTSLSRSPATLLEECGSGWHKVLKKRGVLVLAFNSLVISRKKMIEILEKQGFSVLNEGGYANLSHSVDHSILRDVVVAVKSSENEKTVI